METHTIDRYRDAIEGYARERSTMAHHAAATATTQPSALGPLVRSLRVMNLPAELAREILSLIVTDDALLTHKRSMLLLGWLNGMATGGQLFGSCVLDLARDVVSVLPQ